MEEQLKDLQVRGWETKTKRERRVQFHVIRLSYLYPPGLLHYIAEGERREGKRFERLR